jgi:DHA1 family multidrug resistance protein-like MFS transporter
MSEGLAQPLPGAEAAPPGDKVPSADPNERYWVRSLAAAWLAQLLSMVAFSFVMPFIPFYIRSLGVTSEKAVAMWAGLAITGSGMMMAVFAPVWGVVSDRYGRKSMVQRAMFGGAVVMSVMGLSSNVYQLVGLRALQGMLTGTMSATVALVSSITPRRRLGFSLGMMQMAVFAGSAIGPWLGGIASDRFGYRLPFALTGLLLFVAGAVVLFLVFEDFKPAPVAEKGGVGLSEVLALPGFKNLLLLVSLTSFGFVVFVPTFPLFVEHLMHAKTNVASMTGMIESVASVMAGLSAVTIGRIGDRFGHRRLLVSCTTLSGIFSTLAAFVRSIPELVGFRIVFGFAAGGTSPVMNAIIAEAVPVAGFGRAYGLTTAAGSIGWGLGPLVGGFLAAQFGLRMPFVATGVMLIAVSLFAAGYFAARRKEALGRIARRALAEQATPLVSQPAAGVTAPAVAEVTAAESIIAAAADLAAAESAMAEEGAPD